MTVTCGIATLSEPISGATRRAERSDCARLRYRSLM